MEKNNINTSEFWNGEYSKGIYQDSNPEQFNLLYKPFLDEVLSKIDTLDIDQIGISSCLELGCGLGNVINYIKKTCINCTCYAVDFSDKIIEENKKRFLEIDFINADVFDILDDYRDLGVIVAFEILEHFHEPLNLLLKIYKSIADDGMLLFSVPMENGINDKNEYHYTSWNYQSTTQQLLKVGFKKVEFHSNIMNHNQIIGVAYK